MKPVALQLYSVRKEAEEDFFGVLKKVAAMGYAGVEPAGLQGKKPSEVRKVLDDLGLAVCSAHMPQPSPENIQETMDTAQALGCNMLVSGKKAEMFTTSDSIKAVADSYRQAIALFKPHGLRVVYHNHWWEMVTVDGQCAYDILMKHAPELEAELDVYWASNFGAVNVPDLIGRYKARIPLLHLKDGPLVKGEPHTAVGAGKMDIPACVNALDPKVTQWLIVELDSCATDMMAAVRSSCDYLVKAGLGRGRK